MKDDLRFIACVGLLVTLTSPFAYADLTDPCTKNHYILTSPGGDCTFPAVTPDLKKANRWTPIGSDGAKVVALAVDPHTSATVFAGTAGAGVLKSMNGGESWASVNAGLPTLYVPALAIDPRSAGIIYAGTDAGLFKSADGGRQWVAANTGLGGAVRPAVRALAIDPESPDTVYAGTSAGVFRSVNAAASWTLLGNGAPGDSAFISIDPTSPATLYVGGYDGRVYKSVDGAATWTTIREPFSQATAYYEEAWPLVEALAIDPKSPAQLYLATQEGVVISRDGGMSWSGRSGASYFCGAVYGCEPGLRLWGLFVAALAIDPASSATVYAAADDAVFRSDDYGEHWTVTTRPIERGADINALAVMASGPATLYAGASTGIFRTLDGTQTWTRLPLGVATSPVIGVAVDPAAPTSMYTTSGPVIAKTIDGGLHWADASAGLPVHNWFSPLAIDPLTPSTLFAGGQFLFRSSNGGDHWRRATTYNVQTIAIAASRPSTLYIGVPSKGVFKSENNAATWTLRDEGLPNATGIPALAVDPTNADIVYVGSPVEATIFKSTDGADHWRQLPIVSPPGTAILSIAIAPNSPSTMYAGYNSQDPAGAGVYASSDGGETWVAPKKLLPSAHLSGLVVDPTAASRIYAATLGGVFVSNDGAASWTPMNIGLSSLQVNGLAFDRSGTVLRAATAGGLFEYRFGASPGIVPVVEYAHAGIGHFFMTANPDEIAALDGGAPAGWLRTGYQFNVYRAHAGSSVPVCRFSSKGFEPKTAHFYTPYADECAALRTNADWDFEIADAFEVELPGSGGTCAAGHEPVYRLYNNGRSGAPNHRYTIESVVAAQMVAQGWVQEGLGADAVGMCAPRE